MSTPNTIYGPVRRSIIAACAELKPEEWGSVIDELFQQLQTQNIVSSWSASPYLQGLIINLTLPDYPTPVDIIVLPRTGKPIGKDLS